MYAMKVLLPKELFFNAPKLTQAIANALDGAALGAKVDFEVTTATWKTKPNFEIVKEAGKRHVMTHDKIYKDINDGTDKRFVIMTHDFQAKTVPHKLMSRAGKGGVLAKAKKPMPGIEAREFDKAVKEKWDKQLPIIFQRAIDAAVGGK